MAKEIFLDELEKAEDLFLEEFPSPTKNPVFFGDLPLGDAFTLQDPKPINAGKDIYRKLFEEEAPWDSAIPIENMLALQLSYPTPSDAETQAKLNINALYFADQFNIPFADAFMMHDQLAESFFDVEDTPDGYYNRIKKRYQNGVLNNAISDKGSSLLFRFLKDPASVDLEQELKIIQALQKGFNFDANKDVRSWHEKMLGATTEQLPVLGRGIKGGIKGGVAGGASGAISGLLLGVAIPTVGEEPFTTTAGLFYGLKVGSALGAGIEIGKLEAGNTFANLMSMKDENGNPIDPKIAAIASLAVGVINGGIEVAEWAVLLSTFGIGTKVFEKAAQRVTKTFLVKGTLGQIVSKHVLKFGGQLTVETIQELAQEATAITAEELAKELNNARKGTDFKPITKEDLVARLEEVTVESLRAFPALLLPGTVVSVTKEVITRPPTAAAATDKARQPVPKLGKEPIPIAQAEEFAEGVEPVPPKPAKVIEEVFEGDGTGIPSTDRQQQLPQQVKESKSEEQINSIVNEPLTPEQAEEDLTEQESAALKKLEAEIEVDDAEIVKPKLHIGNVTQRMKKNFAAIFAKQPEDVGPFLEGAFPTKKASIEMTKGEARGYLEFLEEDLARRLDKNLIRTENDLAKANADWGDIKAVRQVLGEKLGTRPFTVIRAEATKVFTIESTKERIAASLRPGN